MQKLFRDAVVRSKVPFAVVSGEGDARLASATEAIDAFLLAHHPSG